MQSGICALAAEQQCRRCLRIAACAWARESHISCCCHTHLSVLLPQDEDDSELGASAYEQQKAARLAEQDALDFPDEVGTLCVAALLAFGLSAAKCCTQGTAACCSRVCLYTLGNAFSRC